MGSSTLKGVRPVSPGRANRGLYVDPTGSRSGRQVKPAVSRRFARSHRAARAGLSHRGTSKRTCDCPDVTSRIATVAQTCAWLLN
jgi:hypothetical protein